MNSTDIASRFQPTSVGVNVPAGHTNLIDYATGIQIWSGWSIRPSGRLHEGGFRVGIPATAKNSGVKAVTYGETLEEAFVLAAALYDKAAAKMARLHREALKMDAAR